MDGLRALVALHAELQQSVAKVREVREEAKLALRRGSQALLELRQKFARSAAAKGAAAAARLDGAKARLGAIHKQRERAKAAQRRKQEQLPPPPTLPLTLNL